ncbi:hypothetical protein TNCV_1873831 [Trichonephila clavipes]|nr:hypothetical protein TNCV_1873831 [Trichonephila clavipes]
MYRLKSDDLSYRWQSHLSQHLDRATCPRTPCVDSRITCADSRITCADSRATCPRACADFRARKFGTDSHGCCFARQAHVVRIWRGTSTPAYTHEPQLLHTVPSIFDGNNDLISFLDEFERELGMEPMDLRIPRLNHCVKKSIGFKAIQPMDLSCS